MFYPMSIYYLLYIVLLSFMSIVTFFTIYYHYDYPFVIYYLKVYESMIIYDPLSIIIYYYILSI